MGGQLSPAGDFFCLHVEKKIIRILFNMQTQKIPPAQSLMPKNPTFQHADKDECHTSLETCALSRALSSPKKKIIA